MVDEHTSQKIIILADDDPQTRHLQRLILVQKWQKDGYRIIECDDGHQALEVAKKHGIANIALVITDGEMPFMNGEQLIEALRAESKDLAHRIPIIMVSGNDDVREAVNPQTKPPHLCADFISSKPIVPDDLIHVVDELIQNGVPRAGEAIKGMRQTPASTLDSGSLSPLQRAIREANASRPKVPTLY